MFQVTRVKEIIVKTSSWVGAFTHVSKIVAERGISILAISCTSHELTGIVRMVTDDNLRAMDVLRLHRFNAREHDVIQVEVPHRPGLLRQITLILEKAKVDVRNLYATSLPDADKSLIVLDTTANEKALIELKRAAMAMAAGEPPIAAVKETVS